MPYFPYTDRDPSTGLYSGRTPLGSLLDRAAAAVCSSLTAIGRWTAAAYRAVGIPNGAAGLLAGLPITNALCQPSGGAPRIPIAPSLPQFPVNCGTFGIAQARVNVAGEGFPPVWVNSEFRWQCSDGLGRPITGLVWRQITPSTWGYVVTFERADGLGTVNRSFGSTTFGDRQDRVQVLNVSIDYCPGCGQTVPPPPPPDIPRRQDDPPVIERPIINIDIDFPSSPGLPPISFPVQYSPVLNFSPRLDLNPILVLAPRLDLNPNFNFAPTFEFSFGGISIGGGGYSEPRQDFEQTLEVACPDPCPPSSGVDYERIARITEERLEAIRDIPGRELGTVIGSPVSGDEVSIGLPDGCRGILYELDLENYTGGATLANAFENSIFYAAAGWFGFSANYPGGERKFLNAPKGYLEAPAFANRFTAVCRLGASITIRTVSSAAFPEP